MRVAIVAVLALSFTDLPTAESTDVATPKLLLTPQRLRRLQRDRERQTVRWLNFENRVESVPESPERGFELALYYAVTHDEKQGREAVQWALTLSAQQTQVVSFNTVFDRNFDPVGDWAYLGPGSVSSATRSARPRA